MSAAPLRRAATAAAYQNQLRLRRAVRTAPPHVRQSPPQQPQAICGGLRRPQHHKNRCGCGSPHAANAAAAPHPLLIENQFSSTLDVNSRSLDWSLLLGTEMRPIFDLPRCIIKSYSTKKSVSECIDDSNPTLLVRKMYRYHFKIRYDEKLNENRARKLRKSNSI